MQSLLLNDRPPHLDLDLDSIWFRPQLRWVWFRTQLVWVWFRIQPRWSVRLNRSSISVQPPPKLEVIPPMYSLLLILNKSGLLRQLGDSPWMLIHKYLITYIKFHKSLLFHTSTDNDGWRVSQSEYKHGTMYHLHMWRVQKLIQSAITPPYLLTSLLLTQQPTANHPKTAPSFLIMTQLFSNMFPKAYHKDVGKNY